MYNLKTILNSTQILTIYQMNQFFFVLNISNERDIIDKFLKKNFWKSHFANIYKRQFENYYDVNYFNYECVAFKNSIQSHIFKDDNFIQFAMMIRETSQLFSIAISIDFELINYFNAFLFSCYFAFHILNYWKIQKAFFSKFFAMAKNVLIISCVEIEMKRLFNMTRNVIIYRRNWFNFKIIEAIMLIKFVALKNSLNENENAFFHDDVDEFYANELSKNATKKLSFVWIDDDDKKNEHVVQKQNNDDMIKNLLSKEDGHEIKNVNEIKNISFNKQLRLNNATSFFFFIDDHHWYFDCQKNKKRFFRNCQFAIVEYE